MTLNEFRSWALAQGSVGKATDGGYVGECVSLVNQYLSKVHGINAGAWGNAKDWANTNHPIRQWFTPVNKSQAGDIGVSRSGGGGYGHIWIYGDNDILEQNGRIARRVTTSPDRNADVILRPKAGMPQAPSQGGNMAKVDTGLNRIVHSEMEGWPLKETHEGKFDSQFAASWGGRDLGEMVWEKWNKNGPWRARRQAALEFYDKYSSTIGELSERPSKAELEAANAKLAEEAKKVEKATAEAEAARLAAAAAEANKSEDTKLLDEGGSWLSKIIKRLFGGK